MNIDIMPPIRSRWETDPSGRFGPFGGRYIPETLMSSAIALTDAYAAVRADRAFWTELHESLRHYVGRPSPLYHAKRLSDRLGGARIYLKREDLNHTGAHKINNTMGQVLLAHRLGKRRVIAETGAGQHGVATATAAACHGLECVVYMGAEDVRRQKLNVFRMELLGAKVVSVETGQRTLKDAINAAMRDWMGSSDHTHYVIGSVMGPHPYPLMVRDFQSVIGREARAQVIEQTGRLPEVVTACVGGGSNAAGIFTAFLDDAAVRLIGVEAAGDSNDSQNRAATVRERSASCLPPYQGGTEGGSSAEPKPPRRSSAPFEPRRSYEPQACGSSPLVPGRHAATLSAGRPGILHGMFTYVLQDDDGQTSPVHSVSAGLDYPGVGPEHAYWKDCGRVEYVAANDADAIAAFTTLCETEGIIPALESAHAVAHAITLAPTMKSDATLVINLSGRGDKDVTEVGRLLARFTG